MCSTASGASIIASKNTSSSNLDAATDNVIPYEYACGTGGRECAVVESTGSTYSTWITVNLGEAKDISTIVFLGKGAENIDGFASMKRMYGLSSDPYDIDNTEISQAGVTNFPFMIADIDNGGPASV